MAEITHMPKLSDTMTEGVVAQWHKKIGDTVEAGELLAEIETDKATMEFESFHDGVLLHIGVGEGETSPVDTLLCIIGKKGEDISALLTAPPASTPAPVPAAAPTPVPAPVAAPVAAAPAAPAPVAVAASVPSSNGRLKSSPLARRLAEEKGIDIAAVAGSGEGGRIVKRDVEGFTPAAVASFGVPTGTESFTDHPVSQMRKTIARRLAESKFTAPHFYLTIDVDMDAAVAARKQVNAIDGIRISFNDMVVKAVATALKKHPAVNSSWLEDRIRTNDHVNVGIAVAVEDGLLVPVVRQADLQPMSAISAQVRDFAQRARDKKLQPKDWEGSTFTISNLGMFGIEEFTAIINPPDACIMAVGAIRQEAVVKDGAVVPGNRMKVTLSCDHRVVDGASGAAFLQTFKQHLENPVLMLV